MDKKLLAILVCPLCKGQLILDKKKSELICKFDKLGYNLLQGIPNMLIDEARKIKSEELENL